jgi:CheY-like chemotaxis protein
LDDGARSGQPDVLVLDDDAETVEGLLSLLSVNGISAIGFQSGRKAIAALESGLKPRVMIVDLLMPQMSGAAVIAEKNRHPDLVAIPVVLLTGARLAEPPKGCLFSLEKPVMPTAFLSIIGMLIADSSHDQGRPSRR